MVRLVSINKSPMVWLGFRDGSKGKSWLLGWSPSVWLGKVIQRC